MRTGTQKKLPKFHPQRGLSLLFLLAYILGYSASGAFHQLYHVAVDGDQVHHSAPLAPPAALSLLATDPFAGETCELLAHLRGLSELKDKTPASVSLKEGPALALVPAPVLGPPQHTTRISTSGGPRAPPFAFL